MLGGTGPEDAATHRTWLQVRSEGLVLMDHVLNAVLVDPRILGNGGPNVGGSWLSLARSLLHGDPLS